MKPINNKDPGIIAVLTKFCQEFEIMYQDRLSLVQEIHIKGAKWLVVVLLPLFITPLA